LSNDDFIQKYNINYYLSGYKYEYFRHFSFIVFIGILPLYVINLDAVSLFADSSFTVFSDFEFVLYDVVILYFRQDIFNTGTELVALHQNEGITAPFRQRLYIKALLKVNTEPLDSPCEKGDV
jgi:hypothetical protein